MRIRFVASALFSVVISASMAHANGQSSKAVVGKASWYKCCKRTANGERFNPDGLTAAHRTLPFGSKVLVENIKTGKAVVVRINDRGPFKRSRVIDVSRGAAKQLGMIGSGVTSIRMTVLR